MSTVTTIPTIALRPNDTLLVGSSVVIVDSIEPDDFADGYWLKVTCVSGNFEQWEGDRHIEADDEWRVLNAQR